MEMGNPLHLSKVKTKNLKIMQQMMFEAEIWKHGFTPAEVELMSATHTLQETTRDCKIAHRAILKQNLSFEEEFDQMAVAKWMYAEAAEDVEYLQKAVEDEKSQLQRFEWAR